MHGLKKYIIFQAIVAWISVSTSAIVVLTFLLFRELRSKPFMGIIAFIAVSDLIGNSPYLSPDRPPSNSPGCYVESFTNQAVYPCSWLWNTVLVYFLYILATEKRVPNIQIFHAVCWPVPIVLFLISLGFVESFSVPPSIPFEICLPQGYVIHIYHAITYYGMFFVSMISMSIMAWKMFALERERSGGTNDPTFQLAKSALILYPASLFICWFPHVFTVIVNYGTNDTSEAFLICYYFGDLLKICHGFVTGIIFFSKSHEGRKHWAKLIFGRTKVPPPRESIEMGEMGAISECGTEYTESIMHNSDISVSSKIHVEQGRDESAESTVAHVWNEPSNISSTSTITLPTNQISIEPNSES